MKRLTWLVAGIVALALQLASVAHSQVILVGSTFNSGDEGWTNVMLPYPSAIPPTILDTFTPVWEAGHLKLADPDGSGQSGNCQYWRAPAQFHGSFPTATWLLFKLDDVGSGFGTFHQEDVILVGGGITVVNDLGGVPPNLTTLIQISLDGSHWKRDGLGGPPATASEMATVLANVTDLFIRAEYQLGPDTQYIDDVGLGTGFGAVGDAALAPALELAAPAPNPSSQDTRVAFVLPSAAACDVAVFDASGRRVATLARGTLAAGRHEAAWDGRDADGRIAGAGLYWVRVVAGAEQRTQKLVRSR